MGAKKKSLAQMEKQQAISKREREKTAKPKPTDKKLGGVGMPNLSDEQFLKEVSKMRVITPYGLASQYGIRLSIAKNALDQLERNNVIRPVAKSSRIRIYEPITGD